MGLSEEITKLAESYDPDKEAEEGGIRAILQGAMYMQASLDRPTPPLRDLVKIQEVEQLTDVDGDYLPYFTIVTGSGIRIRVTLEVEQ
jgi:hypothetical protein